MPNGNTLTTENTSPALSFEADELDALRAAAIMAGQQPKLASALAKLLGVGLALPAADADNPTDLNADDAPSPGRSIRTL